jgi:uncharacterized protein YcbK (DUF882 family)
MTARKYVVKANKPERWASKILFTHILFLVFVSAALIPDFCRAGDEFNRFFYMGSGKLQLKNLRNKKETTINLLNTDGFLKEAALTEVDRTLDFPTLAKGEHISPRLLFMLSYFADRVAPDKPISIESSYRSPEYNDGIRKKGANAARTSTHIDGMAVDFWIEGVDSRKLWETIRREKCCGAGYYGGKDIHLDVGRPRFWEATTSGTKSLNPDYNRHIYLSTDFDRYRPKEKVRLSLSGISAFGFGIQPTLRFHPVADTGKPCAQAELETEDPSSCIMINDRKASRFLFVSLPSDLPAGRYTIQLDFCAKPFAKMPAQIMSHVIEVSNNKNE